jgi:hypothetical protein
MLAILFSFLALSFSGALDEIEDDLNAVVDDYEKRIGELESQSRTNEQQVELEDLQDRLQLELEAEKDEVVVMQAELKRLQEEKTTIIAYMLDNTEECQTNPSGCQNMTYAEMVMKLEAERLRGELTGGTGNDASLEALGAIFENSNAKGQVNAETKKLLEEMEGSNQTADITKLLSLIETLQSDNMNLASNQGSGKNNSMEAVAAISITLFIVAFCAVLFFMFKRRELSPAQAEARYESGKSLIEAEKPYDAAEDRGKKQQAMRAWDNYDQKEGMRLSEQDLINPPRNKSNNLSGYAQADIAGQLGYVTSERSDMKSKRVLTGGASNRINVTSFKTNTTV